MKISYGLKGASSELRVASDLMLRGYQVFRNLSPDGPVDLIVIDLDGMLLTVQVKTGSVVRGEYRSHRRDAEQFDIYAVVNSEDGSIEYAKDV